MRQASRSLTTRSIRFRMTALYTLLLALLLLALSYSLSTLLERRLYADVDHQIHSTAEQVFDQVQGAYPFTPRLDPLASAGLYIQLLNPDGSVASSSSNLGDVVLPAAPISSNDHGPVYQTGTVDGIEIRTVHLTIYNTQTDDIVGAINVGESLLPLTRTLTLLHELLIPIAIVGVVLAALGGWFLAGRALRPVDRITATAAAIGAGSDSAASLSTRLTVPDTGDEVARLAETFNAMLDRLETTFAAQQRFVADASHELRTPLTAIRGNVDVLLRQARANLDGGLQGDDLAALEDVARESARMGRLIEGLLILARSDAGAAPPRPTEPVRLDLVAEHAVRTASALTNGQQLSLRAPAPVLVPGDYDRLVQVMLILLENAIRHTPQDGRITVDVVQGAADQAQVTVSDTGEGIAPEHVPHIFERFYRADTARARVTGGTGLGLAIAQAIVRGHGGTIGVRSALGVGSIFTVTLPALPAQEPVATPPPNIRFLHPRSDPPVNGHAAADGDAVDPAATGDSARLP